MPKTTKPQTVEASMKKLEAIVEKLESGELDLEKSLKAFEEGVVLTKFCQKKLSEAEKKIQILTENDTLIDFDEDE